MSTEAPRPRRSLHGYRHHLQAASLAAFLFLLTLTVWPLGRVFLGAFLVFWRWTLLGTAVVVAAVLIGMTR